MSTVSYLFDECVPEQLIGCLLKLEPAIEILAVGQPLAPPKGTPDPENLRFAETLHLTLVSRDKKTLPGHIADHWAAGGHTWGVFLLKGDHPAMVYADILHLVWATTQAEEWIDLIEHVPW